MAAKETRSPTLYSFITDHLPELVGRAVDRVKERNEPQAARLELSRGVRLLLLQMVTLLRHAANRSAPEEAEALLAAHADAHGKQLRAEGLTIAQVVHGYGDVCQVVTELAVERSMKIEASEFRTFNACLDIAIAHAVTEFVRPSDLAAAEAAPERIVAIARQLREALSIAMLSFDAIRRGVAGNAGSVATMHARSLIRLRELIDQTFTHVRKGGEPAKEEVAVGEIIQEAEISAMFQSRAESIGLVVSPVASNVMVAVDRQMIAGALWNLIQNAFKFTRARSVISLTTQVTEARVCIEVADECGGVHGDKIERILAAPPEKSDELRLVTGLMTARQAIETNGGILRFANLPSVGCRFTIDLPRTR